MRATCIIATVAAAHAAVSSISADSPLVAYIGRTQALNDGSGGVRMDWLGTGARIGASNASYVTATLRVPATQHLLRLTTWQVNQGHYYPASEPWVIPALGGVNGSSVDVDVPLAAFSTGDSIFALQVPPQYWARADGPLVILRFNSDGVFTAVAPFTRSLEFIGDSITAATNVHAFPPCGDGGYQSDYALSYSSLLCRNFTSNCSTIAVGGKGLVRNCCDNGPRMPDYYRNTMYSIMTGEPYAFGSANKPDGVVIALGTNDYSAGGSPALDAAFTAAYVQFIVNITAWYAAAPGDIAFFAMVGPMSDAYLNATTAAVANVTAAGYKATVVNVFGIHCDGCAGHPGVVGHAAMAAAAQPVIAAALGWTPLQGDTEEMTTAAASGPGGRGSITA